MKQEYKFNKYIFLTIVIINLIYLIIIISQTGTSLIKPYKSISCPLNAMTPCPIPNTLNEILQPGETRKNHNPNLKLATRFNTTVITSLILGLIINHYCFNRKYKFETI